MRLDIECTIKGITIYHMPDDTGRLDDYGRLVNKWESGVIPYTGRSWLYFVSTNHVWTHWRKDWEHVSEETRNEVIAKYGSLKKASYQYALEDMERVRSYYLNKWSYIGVKCDARLEISGLNFTFQSNVDEALWGVEDDSEDHITEIEEDLLLELRRKLSDMGFSMLELDQAFTHVDKPRYQR